MLTLFQCYLWSLTGLEWSLDSTTCNDVGRKPRQVPGVDRALQAGHSHYYKGPVTNSRWLAASPASPNQHHILVLLEDRYHKDRMKSIRERQQFRKESTAICQFPKLHLICERLDMSNKRNSKVVFEDKSPLSNLTFLLLQWAHKCD